MSIQQNFPNIKPTLNLDFANVKALDPRITFARATTATYYDQFGTLQTAASGVARFDHNPITFESLGLLIEEQRTNLLTYSEQFDNAAWNVRWGGAATITANDPTFTAPNGTQTVDKCTATAGGAGVGQAVTLTAGVTYTLSCWVNTPSNTAPLQIATNNSGGGVVAAVTIPVSSTLNRYSLTYTPSTTQTYYVGVGNSVAGQVIYTWGAQLEVGAFPTSYIPTSASQVTRAADNASMIGNNFARWYNQTAGSLFADYSFIGTIGGFRAVAALANPATGNYADAMTMGGQSTANALVNFEVRANSTDQANILLGTAVVNTPYKSAAAFTLNDVAAVNNGVVLGSDTSVVLPFVTTLWIGRRTDGGTGSTTIKRIAYYPRRLTNAQLQAITG